MTVHQLTGYSVVNCCALTVAVVTTVHCNVLNAYGDEGCIHAWHISIYAYLNNFNFYFLMACVRCGALQRVTNSIL